MEFNFRLCLPRDGASVPIVRHICRDALRELGAREQCVSDLEIAVTEACTNVIKHAAGTSKEYEVSVGIDDVRSVIRVIDTGAGFEHETSGQQEAHSGAEGGRGIYLMRTLVDELEFISKPEDGTIVHLEKRMEFEADSVLHRLASSIGGSGT